MLIPRKDIVPDPNQPRKTFSPEKLGELKDSMGGKGPDQPLIVRPVGKGKYMIVTGERRWRADESEEIECIVRDVDDKTAREMQFKENMQREDIDPVELGKAFWEYRKKYKVSQEELGKMIGKSKQTISRYETIYLSSNVTLQDAVRAKKIDVESGSQIASIKDTGRQAAVIQATVKHELKQPEVRQVAKQVKAEPARPVSSIVQEVEKQRDVTKVAKATPAIKQPDRRKQVRDAFQRYSINPTLAPKVAKAVIEQPERPVAEILKEEVPSLDRMMEVRKEKEANIALDTYTTEVGGVAEMLHDTFALLPSLPEAMPDMTVFVAQVRKLRRRLSETLVKLGFPDEVTAAEEQRAAKEEDNVSK